VRLSRSLLSALLRGLGLRGRIAFIIAALIAAAWAWLQPPSAPPARPGPGMYTLDGRIVRVADGDTVTMKTATGQHRIRLASIDAPETGHGNDQPGQPFGQPARDNLAALVAGRTLVARCYEQDRYGRDICDLPLPDGQTANRKQVADGFAWANTVRRGEYLRDKSLPAIQQQAQAAGKGMWAERGKSVPPWQWRQDCWKERRC